MVVPHLQLTFELLQLRSSGGQSSSCECLANSLLAIVGCSSRAFFAGAAACKGAGRCGGVGRGWSAVEGEEAGSGSTTTSRGEQLRVRIWTFHVLVLDVNTCNCVAGSVLSIRDYFRPSNGLPERTGSLSLHVPSQAIALANKEVEEVLKEGSRVDKMKRGKYNR